MSTITKERIANLIEFNSEGSDCQANAEQWEVHELARIALTSLEAEPVADVVAWSSQNEERTCDVRLRRHDIKPGILYTAPPAPASVPDENGLLPCPCCGGKSEFDYDDDNLNWISCNVCGISTDTAYHTDVDAKEKLREVWNRRAAQLQSFGNSEQLNSPVIPDGWVACVERMPSAGEQVLAYRPDAPESNDPLIKMATYVGGSAHGHGFDCYCKPTHWMPLPAAPQQED